MNQKISIVIVTYNREKLLRRGLLTIINQSVLPNEIIVIDDGSVDNTMKAFLDIKNWRIDKYDRIAGDFIHFNYIHLSHPEPRISCIPRNIGWKSATSDIIIFTEPEALHVGNTIDKLLQAMEKHPDNTILASQVWTTQKLISEQLTDDYYSNPEKILEHPYAQLTTSSNLENTKAPNSDWAITGELNCNAGVLFATRKEWLEKIGGFDESFIGHGWDDLDLFNRLAMIGHGVLKDPTIAVIHQYHDKSFYNYNIYEAAEHNGKISEANVHSGRYRVND